MLQQKYSIQFVQQNRPFEKDNIIYNSQRIERSEQQKDYYVIKFNMVTWKQMISRTLHLKTFYEYTIEWNH